MTPEEHYAEAERLAAEVVKDERDGTPPGERRASGRETSYAWIAATLALAQVHATLALVPTSALTWPRPAGGTP